MAKYKSFVSCAGGSDFRKERSAQRRCSKRLSRDDREEIGEHLNLTVQRTRSPGGQTLMVGFFHCGESAPIARWWAISRQLVTRDGETVYGVESEAAALSAVAKRL